MPVTPKRRLGSRFSPAQQTPSSSGSPLQFLGFAADSMSMVNQRRAIVLLVVLLVFGLVLLQNLGDNMGKDLPAVATFAKQGSVKSGSSPTTLAATLLSEKKQDEHDEESITAPVERETRRSIKPTILPLAARKAAVEAFQENLAQELAARPSLAPHRQQEQEVTGGADDETPDQTAVSQQHRRSEAPELAFDGEGDDGEKEKHVRRTAVQQKTRKPRRSRDEEEEEQTTEVTRQETTKEEEDEAPTTTAIPPPPPSTTKKEELTASPILVVEHDSSLSSAAQKAKNAASRAANKTSSANVSATQPADNTTVTIAEIGTNTDDGGDGAQQCRCCERCTVCTRCLRKAARTIPFPEHDRCYLPHRCREKADYGRPKPRFTLVSCADNNLSVTSPLWVGAARDVKDCDCGWVGPGKLSPTAIGCDAPEYRRLVSHCTDLSLPPVVNVSLHSLLSGPTLACYSDDDLVCKVVGKSGGWESGIQGILGTALQQLVVDRIATTTGKSLKFGEVSPELAHGAQADVEFVDIGANVGVFSYNQWGAGYTVHAFDALPYNAQLLRMSRCINMFTRNHTTPDSKKANQRRDNEITVTHSALGKDVDKRCLMISEENNFGDIHITCNETLVNSKDKYVLGKYRRRGAVQLTRLDSFVSKWDHIASHTEGNSGYKDYVVKIDVEGNEPNVMLGAEKWLSSPYKPKLVLSETWRSRNITRYAEFMMAHGYVVWVGERSAWIHNASIFAIHMNQSKLEMDTMVFVLKNNTHIFTKGQRSPDWVPAGDTAKAWAERMVSEKQHKRSNLTAATCTCCPRCKACSLCLRLATRDLPFPSHDRCYLPHQCENPKKSFTMVSCETEGITPENPLWKNPSSHDVSDCDCSFNLAGKISSAAYGCDAPELRRVVSLCTDISLPPVVNVSLHGLLSGPTLACYSNNDIVCNVVGKSGGWEKALQTSLQKALSALVEQRIRATAPHPDNVSLGLARGAQADVEFVDIGANVGVFSYNQWGAGYTVHAFDALPYNAQLLRMSRCINMFTRKYMKPVYATKNQRLDNEITVTHSALGKDVDKRCLMISEENNFGDIHITCNETLVNSKGKYVLGKYRRRGAVQLTRLDSFVSKWDHIASHTEGNSGYKDYVVKIDVEGNEEEVMLGAEKWLSSPYKPKMVLSETWRSRNITRYAEFMMDHGYVVWVGEREAWIRDRHTFALHMNRSKAEIDTMVFVLKNYTWIYNRRDRDWNPGEKTKSQPPQTALDAKNKNASETSSTGNSSSNATAKDVDLEAKLEEAAQQEAEALRGQQTTEKASSVQAKPMTEELTPKLKVESSEPNRKKSLATLRKIAARKHSRVADEEPSVGGGAKRELETSDSAAPRVKESESRTGETSGKHSKHKEKMKKRVVEESSSVVDEDKPSSVGKKRPLFVTRKGRKPSTHQPMPRSEEEGSSQETKAARAKQKISHSAKQEASEPVDSADRSGEVLPAKIKKILKKKATVGDEDIGSKSPLKKPARKQKLPTAPETEESSSVVVEDKPSVSEKRPVFVTTRKIVKKKKAAMDDEDITMSPQKPTAPKVEVTVSELNNEGGEEEAVSLQTKTHKKKEGRKAKKAMVKSASSVEKEGADLLGFREGDGTSKDVEAAKEAAATVALTTSPAPKANGEEEDQGD